VPAWWFIEITNVLAMAERKGRITPAQSDKNRIAFQLSKSRRNKAPAAP